MNEQQKRRVSSLTLFYSYAHEDELLRNELEKHLSLLHRQGLISEWHDRQILAGDEWAADMDQHLETASIILLLISSDFLASNYCYDIEMMRALERHQRGEARVIPIILRPCDWRTSPFARLQCLPHDGKAVTTWQNPDEAFLTIAEGLRRVIERQRIPARPLSRIERQNRIRLMKRVRAIWIEGVLEHSLHQAAMIALDLQEQPDALANPWQLEVQETNLPPRLLPAGTPLVQVYDEAEGELLILGEPGAGKTTLLLQLASDLFRRAEQESTFPMPVIFNLSSWAEKRLPLTDWLIEELFTKYQVPRNLGHSWIKGDQLLLLLDGLDEVTQLHRTSCIRAINAYRREHNLVPVVLCSRKVEYEAQSTRVTLSKAVVIQPLTSQQIDSYLIQAGQQLEAVRSVLHEDRELQELARTPLMLTILALTYQGKAVDDLVTHMPPDMQRGQVLATYVQRMFERRGVDARYTQQQTKWWLAWLARQMVQHNQVEFYIERMQPGWLPNRQLSKLYRRIVTWLIYGLVSGLVGGLFAVLRGGFRDSLDGGLLGGLFGWLGGKVVERLLAWLSYGLGGGIGGGATIGLLFVLVSLLVAILVGKQNTEIESVEAVSWSWMHLRQRLLQGLMGGLIGGLIAGLAFGLVGGLILGLIGGVTFGLFHGLVYGLLALLIVGLIRGLVVGLRERRMGNILEEHSPFKSHQGIWFSGHYSMLVEQVDKLIDGLIVGLIGGLIFGLVTTLLAGLFPGIVYGLLVWLLASLIFCLSDNC